MERIKDFSTYKHQGLLFRTPNINMLEKEHKEINPKLNEQKKLDLYFMDKDTQMANKYIEYVLKIY